MDFFHHNKRIIKMKPSYQHINETASNENTVVLFGGQMKEGCTSRYLNKKNLLLKSVTASNSNVSLHYRVKNTPLLEQKKSFYKLMTRYPIQRIKGKKILRFQVGKFTVILHTRQTSLHRISIYSDL